MLLAPGLCLAGPRQDHTKYYVDMVELSHTYKQRMEDPTVIVSHVPFGVRLSKWVVAGADDKLKAYQQEFDGRVLITLRQQYGPDGGFANSAMGYQTYSYEHTQGLGSFTIEFAHEDTPDALPDAYQLIVTEASAQLVPIRTSFTAIGDYAELKRTRPICTATTDDSAKDQFRRFTCRPLNVQETRMMKSNDRNTRVEVLIQGL